MLSQKTQVGLSIERFGTKKNECLFFDGYLRCVRVFFSYMTISGASQCRFVVYQLARALFPKGLSQPLVHLLRSHLLMFLK